ncbi:tetratricopeptide repeat protein [Pseudomonas tritici]|uniref:tetratricopeptide repeat protein n=1 Tax=Pseudomonas tritici TaxID=2745518 RepID=UPI00387B34C8
MKGQTRSHVKQEPKVNLSHEFSTAANLGVITKKWYAGIQQCIQDAGLETKINAGVEGAASLLMPAALVANLIKIEGLPADRDLRVLLLGDDPVPVMDRGVWLGSVADLAGVQSVTCYCTCDKELESNLFDVAKDLGMAESPRTSVEAAQSQSWDLAVWIHPAIEAGEHDGFASAMPLLHAAGVPVYACMYNELDALIQSHGLNPHGLEFSWLDSPIATARLTRVSVNKYGYSTSEAGIEGGWGAVLTKLQPASVTSSPEDWKAIKVAMSLFRLEGSVSSTWSFAEVVGGVAFNKYQPVGLIGNMAVDPVTGLLISECVNTKVLKVVGHLWTEALSTRPATAFELVPWAARIKLSFNAEITRETKKRIESIELLEVGLSDGLYEAGIALARGYERMGTTDSKAKAAAIYKRVGDRHPMGAYAVAHDMLAQGDTPNAMGMLRKAVDAGYVPAMTDMAALVLDKNVEEANSLLILAMNRGDAEAAFRLGEMLIKGGLYDAALDCLRTAWSKGHVDALNAAHWVCTEMLKAGLGKSGKLKRELKEIQFAISKRTRLENAVQIDAK